MRGHRDPLYTPESWPSVEGRKVSYQGIGWAEASLCGRKCPDDGGLCGSGAAW